MKLEKTPLAIVYKQDGFINIDFSHDAEKGYELYGFFKCLVNKMEKELTESMEKKS